MEMSPSSATNPPIASPPGLAVTTEQTVEPAGFTADAADVADTTDVTEQAFDDGVDVTDLVIESQNPRDPVTGVGASPFASGLEGDLPASDVIVEATYFSFDSLSAFPHPFRHPIKAGYWLFEVAFGVVSLFSLLALLAAVPIANFLALGYMLEAEGRVARTGKLRFSMPLLPLAAKLGGIAFGVWFWCFLVQLAADAASDAALIAPGSATAIGWRIGRTLFASFVAVHLVLAIARGGRLGLFFWPTPLNGLWLLRQFFRGDYGEKAAAAVREFVAALRLRHHFWLGLRGFLGAFAWLVIPTALFSALQDTSNGIQVLITLIGGVALVCVLSWVPFLQAGFAADYRLSTMFSLRRVRTLYRRAPIAFLVSISVMYALALPLYIFKLFEIPQDMRWMLTPLFVVSIYPARILVGWAYSRAVRKEQNSWLIVRFVCGLLIWPLLGFYVFLLFFTPDISAAGRAVLFQHHALLLPWPF